jgi:NAD(P)-dependent dehydrogenase (short-subunit alcohol dehydrogenase family)
MIGETSAQRLDGRTAIITGAAGGFGSAMTRVFSGAGAKVIAVDLRGDALDAVANEPGVRTVQADISTSEGVDRVFDAAAGTLDILCNNAGVMDGLAWVDELLEEEWERVMRVNLTSAFLLCRRAVPLMVSAGGGVILNMSSIAGVRGGRSGVAYATSKFGLIGLTQNIAATFGDAGIRSNAICPGPASTDFSMNIDVSSERAQRMVTRDRQKPGRVTPERIAALALFLASDDGADISGAAISVDLGATSF